MFKSFGAAAAAMALAVTATPASATCWNAAETSAATIRDFQSLLMVATLRCRAADYDITVDYNSFVEANRALVQHENDRIKAHFIHAMGPIAGQKGYDSFATHLANIYGGGASSPEACDNMAALAREASLMGGSEDGLLLLAAQQGIVTDLPGGTCQAPGSSIAMGGESAPVAAQAVSAVAYNDRR